MRVFWASAIYTYRGLMAWMTPVTFLAQKLLIPLGQIAFFSLLGEFGGSRPLDFYLVGNALVTASTAVLWISLAINEERMLGTLPFLTASPANRFALFYGKSMVHLVEGVLHVSIAFAWAALVFGLALSASSWVGIFVIILIANMAAAGLGLLLGGLAYATFDSTITNQAFYFVVLVVSGANIPTDQLPGSLRLLGLALPLTRSIKAARLVAAGASLTDVAPTLAGELALGVLYALVGFLLFRWMEISARRKGTLEGL